ncbi:unnamed protein product [Allacma fusca]|uniref:Signal recognition particle 14 kDa protein n=1 Tax=Allacma fusca TaxID=39272 RepID=A0A8J2JPJ5_9HEXA|nr:unnamed protein product [Allacma fusca]
MVFLENDTFLLELTRLFQKSKGTGTGQVSIVMKKYNGQDRPTPSLKPKKIKDKKGKVKETIVPKPKVHPVEQHSCLMRAKLHNRKISTVVNSKDVNRFQLAYCNLLKGNMDNLKKLKKTKSKTAKATS